ncbi:MAG: hypothetical protein IKV24_02010 [Bacteroidaceae bacterium]|nr:hypothetical protein [Bacteroidaceae bacterium]
MTFQRLPQVPPMELPEELRETFDLLSDQGYNPQFCDTPVPYFDAGIPCGSPRDVYEAAPDGYLLVPRSLVGNDATVIARVVGDSMKDAGIEEDDLIHVLLDAPVRDGDIVVACIDGACTVKSYFKDRAGRVWLVPCNREYSPIHVTEDMNVHIVGRVVSHRKPAPRASFSDMQRAVSEYEAMSYTPKERTAEDVVAALRQVFDAESMNASDWIAAYRVLVDSCDAPKTFVDFAAYINALGIDELPECNADLLRKADSCYQRPLSLWHQKAGASSRKSLIDKRHAIAEELGRLLR